MDRIEVIGKSIIQHGKESNRVYVMDICPSDFPDIIGKIDALANNKGYTKLFAKVSARFAPAFLAADYETEAFVPGFFCGEEDALFMTKYKDPQRKKTDAREMATFQKMLLCEVNTKIPPLDGSYTIRRLTTTDTEEMAKVFRKVFDTYPFPVFDPAFLKKEMSRETYYFGIFHNNNLVGISSAECNGKQKNAEMTDFAVLPSQRGKKIAIRLLRVMEDYLIAEGFKSLYTIARLKSLSMNKTFMNNGYRYTGTLVNNTQIAGQIESMNVWYKNI